jgi:hypothetical protein
MGLARKVDLARGMDLARKMDITVAVVREAVEE